MTDARCGSRNRSRRNVGLLFEVDPRQASRRHPVPAAASPINRTILDSGVSARTRWYPDAWRSEPVPVFQQLLTEQPRIVTTSATSLGSNQERFVATRWSVVLAAGGRDAGSLRRRALEELARIYWFPLYAYVRRQGQSPQIAEDLTQDFFARLIEKHSLRHVDRSKGKFRSFLLASLKHFLLNEYDKAQAQKRGGGSKVLALDAASAEARYTIEPVDHMTPERVFEQRWAWAVLDQVLLRLREQYDARGQGALFEALKGALMQRPAAGQYAEVARELGMAQGAVVVAAHRLRGRYRKLLRDEIAQTVADPELINEEVQYLLGCL